jgi:hypothetical protein
MESYLAEAVRLESGWIRPQFGVAVKPPQTDEDLRVFGHSLALELHEQARMHMASMVC